jgi:hydroxylaminobenzene mutase
MDARETKRRLLFHAFLLFLVGLLTGLAIPVLTNPRMGVSAHLEGLMNGIFLAILAFAFADLELSDRLKRVVVGLALFAAYANWLMTFLAAVLGTSKLTPIAGQGHTGSEWQEALVSAGLVSLAIGVVTCVGIILFGLRKSSVRPRT